MTLDSKIPSGDIATKIEASPEGLASKEERIGELLGFTASEGYLRLRRELGIAAA